VVDDQGLLQVNAEQQDELASLAQSRLFPAGNVFRALLVLALVHRPDGSL
jgi:hypothetical protein